MCVRAKSFQSCLTLCDPMDHRLPGFSVHGDSPGKNTGVGCHTLLQGHPPNLGIEPTSLTSPAFVGRFLSLAPPPGKPQSLYSCTDKSFHIGRKLEGTLDNGNMSVISC